MKDETITDDAGNVHDLPSSALQPREDLAWFLAHQEENWCVRSPLGKEELDGFKAWKGIPGRDVEALRDYLQAVPALDKSVYILVLRLETTPRIVTARLVVALPWNPTDIYILNGRGELKEVNPNKLLEKFHHRGFLWTTPDKAAKLNNCHVCGVLFKTGDVGIRIKLPGEEAEERFVHARDYCSKNIDPTTVISVAIHKHADGTDRYFISKGQWKKRERQAAMLREKYKLHTGGDQ